MNFLFDIGGTNIRLALLNDKSKTINIDEVAKIPTPDKFGDALNIIKKFLTDNNALGKIERSAGGCTGVLDHTKNKIINSMHLPDWKNKPLREELSLLTQSNVLLENDSTLAALGEASFGIGKDYPIVVYITISTGLGGSRIVNRKIEKSVLNYEPGNQIIFVNNETKYLEEIVSGSGLEKRYGKKAEEIKDIKIWEEVEYFTAIGLNNILVHWSPNIVVIGGAVGKSLNLDNVNHNLKKLMRIYPELPIIKKSTLKHNGIHGALYLLKDSEIF